MTDELEGKLLIGPTVQLFALRTMCASIVLLIILFVTGRTSPSESAFDVILSAPVTVGACALIATCLGWLASKGVPFAGLLGWPLLIAVVPGDPLLFVLWLATRSKWPELIPVASLGFVSLTPIIRVVDGGERLHT
ncbi:MAG: hypothetical protein KC593_04135 [Myxococcales bacterium]|nr:hypothetical protein [Myxococcales bacterium]MCB9628438.1 hypothetical protein [Sandaracinaceae bacterium]